MRRQDLLIMMAAFGLTYGAWLQAQPTTRPTTAPAAQTHPTHRPWLGISITDVADPDFQQVAESLGYTGNTGLLVQAVMPGAPAAGKLRDGDILTEVDGEKITEVAMLQDRIADAGPGGELTLSIFREKKVQTIKVTVGVAPQRIAR